MKKIISLTLALAIVLSMSICAFAAETTTVNADNGTGELYLDGKVLKSNDVISVVMPTTLTFQIGTENVSSAKLATEKGGEAVAEQNGYVFASFYGSEGTITNNSNCAVEVSLAEVADDSFNALLNKVDIFLTGPQSSKTSALTAGKVTAGTLAKLAARGTATIKLTGAEAFADDDTSKVSLPVSDNIRITTTLKVAKTTIE